MQNTPVIAPRRIFHDDIRVQAPVQSVFPLLCPVREYDWIDGWACEMIHSVSGVAEAGCIFRTQFKGEGQMTWVVSAYEPDRHIAFTCFVHPHLVMRLSIDLEPAAPDATLTRWTREFTVVDGGGEAGLAGAADHAAYRQMMARLSAALSHYVSTGTCLAAAAAVEEPA